MWLPPPLGDNKLMAWRLHLSDQNDTWDSGLGAKLNGGRWSSKGRSVVYCALDPSTAIIEVAVHLGFTPLDRVPHSISRIEILDPADVKIVEPPKTLQTSEFPTPEQRQFGDHLLDEQVFVVIPSVVSRQSWNLFFEPEKAAGRYELEEQLDFVLDPRLLPGSP